MTKQASSAIDLLARNTGADEVRREPDLDLFDAGILDSFGLVQYIVALSKQFGIKVSPAEIDRDQFATPRKIQEFVDSRMAATAR